MTTIFHWIQSVVGFWPAFFITSPYTMLLVSHQQFVRFWNDYVDHLPVTFSRGVSGLVGRLRRDA